MAKPEVPIDVDPATGIWTTDGLPMIYVPRHFYMNYFTAVDAALGRERHQTMLYDSSYQSAFQWAEAEAKTHGLRGIAILHHYLGRLSQRGWARFTVESADVQAPHALVRVEHSAFCLHLGKTGKRECGMFAGSLAGSLAWCAGDAGVEASVVAVETACMSEGHPHCRFEVRRA